MRKIHYFVFSFIISCVFHVWKTCEKYFSLYQSWSVHGEMQWTYLCYFDSMRKAIITFFLLVWTIFWYGISLVSYDFTRKSNLEIHIVDFPFILLFQCTHSSVLGTLRPDETCSRSVNLWDILVKSAAWAKAKNY